MNTSRPRAVIVTPTLNLREAVANIERAKEMAGVPCASVVVEDVERRGRVLTVNAGWKAALSLGLDYLVVLNPDARAMTEGWLSMIIRALESDDQFGIAGARGGCRGGPQMREWIWSHVEVKRPLSDFMMVAKREVFVDIGYYDDALIHYAGESDWQMRAMKKGWRVILVPGVFFDHEPSKTNAAWWAHDRAIYTARWGDTT